VSGRWIDTGEVGLRRCAWDGRYILNWLFFLVARLDKNCFPLKVLVVDVFFSRNFI
jgi:hypothetical protein